MHKILNRTHRPSNINLLKARDYYFDKARVANNRYGKICMLTPIFLTVTGMLAGSILSLFQNNNQIIQNINSWLDSYLDAFVGITSVIAFIANLFIDSYVGSNMEKSNVLREEYDCRVFNIDRNPFWDNSQQNNIPLYEKKAAFMPDRGKYEVWYREIFSSDDFANTICLMMDNAIYTYHVYKVYRKKILRELICIAIVFALYSAWFLTASVSTIMVNPFILFLAVFDEVKELIESYLVSKEQEEETYDLIDFVKNNKDLLMQNKEQQKTILRSAEDVIYSNRQKSLFIPKTVRNKFLSNDCIYYKDLDYIKSLYLGKNVTRPTVPEEYEICTAVTGAPSEYGQTKETSVVNMQQIHEELLKILDDVKQLFDRNGIRFMLDGGTLIGSMRKSNNNSFLAWDDDVDISIRSQDAQKAMDLIRKEFAGKYNVQDYYSEENYSPRLSRFRIRQLNTVSFIDEKDSELFELYKDRGLFIDVYAYSPILVNKKIDTLYRKLFVYPLNKKIRLIETKWKTSGKKEKYRRKFLRIKKQYQKQSEWYKKHASCSDYYTYEPQYVENLKKPGPYIKKSALYGNDSSKKNYSLFEGRSFEVPLDPNEVLSAFYGKNWEKSPFASIQELMIPQDKQDTSSDFDIHMYSKNEFDSTLYKHVKCVSILGKDYSVEE